MKKVLLVSLLCMLPGHAVGQTPVYDTIRYAREYYQERVSLFKNESVEKGRVIVLGNSIAEFGHWKRLLNDSSVINRGIAADNTFGVLDRLDDVIIRAPGKLLIEIGINDIAQNIPVNIIVKNILTIVGRVKAKSPATKMYVHSILPTNDNVKNEYPDAFNKNSVADSVNRLLDENVLENGYTYIDLNRELSDAHGKLDSKYAASDGLHLNEAGYQVWIRLLKKKKVF
jgi:lysophospholipase L1-like esterase